MSGRPPGTRARCRCGTVFTLPEPEEQAGQLSCPGCGANVAPSARECEFCDAALLVKACPRCFARIFHGARHCNHCGAQVDIPAAANADGRASRRRCPSCDDGTELEGRLAGETLLDECTSCHGLFLDAAALERVIRERRAPSVQQVAGVAGTGESAGGGPVRRSAGRAMYIKCPDCETVMNRKNFGRSSGIIVDSCRAHGTWFDADELPRVIQFVASGGLSRAQARAAEDESERARQARVSARIAEMRAQRSLGEVPAERNAGIFGGILDAIGDILIEP